MVVQIRPPPTTKGILRGKGWFSVTNSLSWIWDDKQVSVVNSILCTRIISATVCCGDMEPNCHQYLIPGDSSSEMY